MPVSLFNTVPVTAPLTLQLYLAMSAISNDTRLWQRKYCPHCDETVSKSTYYRHRSEYYDGNMWKTSKSQSPNSNEVEANTMDETEESCVPGTSFSENACITGKVYSAYVYTYMHGLSSYNSSVLEAYNVDYSTIYSSMIYLVDSEHENASSDSESGDSVEDINLEVTSAELFLVM